MSAAADSSCGELSEAKISSYFSSLRTLVPSEMQRNVLVYSIAENFFEVAGFLSRDCGIRITIMGGVCDIASRDRRLIL